MTPSPAWQPERYRALLRFKVRQLQLDPRFQCRFDSSDLVQETLLRAHQNLAQFRGQTDAEFVQWLDAVLTNAAHDEIRKATAGVRNVYLEEALPGLLADSSARLERFLAANQPAPNDQLERQELLLGVAQAMEQLPDDQRDVIVLRYASDRSVKDIAQQMDRTPKSVAGLLRRALEKLRELLAADS